MQRSIRSVLNICKDACRHSLYIPAALPKGRQGSLSPFLEAELVLGLPLTNRTWGKGCHVTSGPKPYKALQLPFSALIKYSFRVLQFWETMWKKEKSSQPSLSWHVSEASGFSCPSQTMPTYATMEQRWTTPKDCCLIEELREIIHEAVLGHADVQWLVTWPTNNWNHVLNTLPLFPPPLEHDPPFPCITPPWRIFSLTELLALQQWVMVFCACSPLHVLLFPKCSLCLCQCDSYASFKIWLLCHSLWEVLPVFSSLGCISLLLLSHCIETNAFTLLASAGLWCLYYVLHCIYSQAVPLKGSRKVDSAEAA